MCAIPPLEPQRKLVFEFVITSLLSCTTCMGRNEETINLRRQMDKII